MFNKIKISILILVFFLLAHTALAALSCSVTPTCSSPNVVVLRMSDTTNAHAELPSESNYSQLLCCGGVSGLANSCSNNFGVALRLSGVTNAHVEENTESTVVYDGQDACLSVSSGTVTIGYQNSNCTGFDTTMASISGTPTNAHIGDSIEYTRKVCATVTITETPSSGGGSVGVEVVAQCELADFNCDGRVNILDLSILLFYLNNSSLDISKYDLNQDGKINLSDISIMFYYWDI